MNLWLNRNEYHDSGVFGDLTDENGKFYFVTGERGYNKIPKLPNGTYTCVRGTHRLSDLVPFETFEITGVKGHFGIVFHPGNYPQKDSDGCVLLGLGRGRQLDGGHMITDSKRAFERFMKLQEGCDSFELVVEGEMPS